MERTKAAYAILLAVCIGASLSTASRELTQESVKPKQLMLPGVTSTTSGPELPTKYAAVMAGNTYAKTGKFFTDSTNPAAVPKPAAAREPRPAAAAVAKPDMKKKAKVKHAKVLIWPGPVLEEKDLPRP